MSAFAALKAWGSMCMQVLVGMPDAHRYALKQFGCAPLRAGGGLHGRTAGCAVSAAIASRNGE